MMNIVLSQYHLSLDVFSHGSWLMFLCTFCGIHISITTTFNVWFFGSSCAR